MTSRQPQHSSRRAAYTTVVVAFLALVGCLGLTTAASAASTASASASTSAAPYCGIYWGSLLKEAGNGGATSLAGVRTGRHDCYDRLVLDLNGGPAAAYRVDYVDAVYEDGSGKLVPLRGGARLRIVVYAPSYDIVDGHSTYTPANPAELADVTGYQTFRQIAFAGSFEGQTNIGLGVRARLPFRVFTLAGPGSGSRLVIDVAHHW
jgi:hypothetical protein